MTRRHDPAWVWMIGALGGGLAIAVAVLADYGTGPDGIGQAVPHGALGVPFFLAFLCRWRDGHPVRPSLCRAGAPARDFGLAFAAAIQVHIGLVIWLGVVIGQIPLQGGVLWLFLVALFFADLLALLSFGTAMRNLGRLRWPLLFLGTTYILYAFGTDFVPGALATRRHSIGVRR